MVNNTAKITRDQLTWLLYLMLGYYSYMLNGLGPLMPFLRAELGMSYTVTSLHFSAFAIGMLLAGLGSDRIARRFGRHGTFWIGALGMAGGTAVLMGGFHPMFTIIGALLMGTIGSMLIVMIPAMLSDRYGSQRAVVISEANGLASICGGLAPIALGVFVRIGFGWRAAMFCVILVMLVIGALFYHVPFPEPKHTASRQSRASAKLPGVYWMYWSLLVLAVSAEFCLVFWSSTFLETEHGLPRPEAAFAMSVFLGAMVVGRLLGSRISFYFQSEDVVLGSAGLGVIGFLLHWLASPMLLTMFGLFVAGLGVANLYPQILALAVGAAPDQTDTASARASLASGSAILLLPLLLGGLADHIGIRYAYGIVVILLTLTGVGIVWVQHAMSLKECKS